MRLHTSVLLCAVIALTVTVGGASAATIQIQLSGVNTSYDGTAIYDGGANAGGNLNPAQADPLTTVTFLDDSDNVIALFTTDISLDLFIPDVSNIPDAPNTNYEVNTPGNPGFFDLLFGTSPLATNYLALDLSEVNVRYFDIQNQFQFSFGAAVADIGGQDLPLNLVVGDPVTVSFSAQVTSRTTGGGFITSFRAGGTGEIRATLIPEPTSVALLTFGLLAGMLGLRRRR